jgi:hypothetical protein
MNDASAGQRRNPGRYEIRFQGHLASRWAAWFEGMTLTSHSDGTTVLEGPVVDQAALHGLLTKLRDLGLPLISLAHLDTDPQTPPPTPAGTSPEATPARPKGD